MLTVFLTIMLVKTASDSSAPVESWNTFQFCRDDNTTWLPTFVRYNIRAASDAKFRQSV